jgi:NAD(P)H-quinone oxidoreductase subunit 5
MTTALPWIALLAPLIPGGFALWSAAPARPRQHAEIAIAAATAAFAVSLVVASAVFWVGPVRTPLLGAAGIGFSLAVDALAAIMLVLVSFVGLVVVRYSRNYLDGDPGHVQFTRHLLMTLASVLLLIISGNVALLIVAWVGTSLGLNALLLFYGARPAAQRAARKKFLASRVGDVCLLIAAVLLYARFGTLEITDIAASARSGTVPASAALTCAALLIVITAMLKSAQLPLHGWLLEVMETPTPVSALLHAGIINAGGFLVLRLSDVLVLATPALDLLAIIGGLTALFGSLVMLTQTSVKVQLAYSTVAQMGFMLLQCGLGAFSSALLHIVAHSLYKAHAFLSSGSVMDLARASWTPSPGGQPHPARLIIALGAVVGVTVGIGALFGITPTTDPARLALGCILLMGLVHLVANAIDERPDAFLLARAAVTAAGVAVLYFALQAAMHFAVATSVPSGRVHGGAAEIAVATLVVVAFAAVTVFQNELMRHAERPFFAAAYTHLRHGLYLNTLANRLVLAYWPSTAPARNSATS